MTEDEAQSWIGDGFGALARDAMLQVAALVVAGNETQNLIAPSTVSSIWSRHIVDSAQLVSLSGDASGEWLDIGSGAGFPGLVVAALTDRHVTLVEPRRRRAEFLIHASEALGITQRVTVLPQKVDTLKPRVPFEIISARAVASLEAIFGCALQCSTWNSRWLLPKGRAANVEIANVKRAWHGVFHVEQSITDPVSMIVIASQVRPK